MWPVWGQLSLFGRPVMLTGYGLFAILGVVLGTYLCVRTARRLGFPEFDAFATSTLAVAFGLLGAKLLFIAVSLRLYEDGTDFLLQTSGLVWYGGLFGGGIAALIYLSAYHLSIATCADALAPGLALGHALGRVGCFMAGCCYGKPTTLPWGVRFPASPFFAGPVGHALHPVQLYEAVAESVLATLAWRLAGRVARGTVFLGWLASYSVVRLTFELLLRGDDRGARVLGLPPSAVVSVALFVGAAGALFWRWRLTTETNVS